MGVLTLSLSLSDPWWLTLLGLIILTCSKSMLAFVIFLWSEKQAGMLGAGLEGGGPWGYLHYHYHYLTPDGQLFQV